jgi:hypothetical protein
MGNTFTPKLEALNKCRLFHKNIYLSPKYVLSTCINLSYMNII